VEQNSARSIGDAVISTICGVIVAGERGGQEKELPARQDYSLVNLLAVSDGKGEGLLWGITIGCRVWLVDSRRQRAGHCGAKLDQNENYQQAKAHRLSR
jgi:hypothetical protein